MSDQIQKFLAKAIYSERVIALEVMELLKQGKFSGLDIKKLSGAKDLFRVRKGRLRIIYRFDKKQIKILSIGNRDDNTYNKF